MDDTYDPLAARRRITSVLYGMRYGAAVGIPIPSADVIENGDEHSFLTEIAVWLEVFSERLIAVSDTAQQMSDELEQLRRQRQAVRDFLGL